MAVNEVIAVSGVKPPPPWVLLESSTFSGRYYFFNTTSLESKWSLPETLFESNSPEDVDNVIVDESDHQSNFNTSLEAAQQAVRRMEARYGASPSRPSDDITENMLEENNINNKNGKSNKAKGKKDSFSKRSRDLDPRMMSIDLEEHLTSALNKADKIEQSWATIPEEDVQKQNKTKKSPKSNSSQKSNELPSNEAFNAMNNGFEEDEDGNIGNENENSNVNDEEVNRKSTQLLAQSYTVINGLGSGGYSNVLLVSSSQRKVEEGGESDDILEDPNDGLMAMKVLSKRLLKRPRDRARLRNELRALTEIPPSRFVERCFSAFETPSHVCFVTEYLCGGDLFFHLTSRAEEQENEDGDAVGFPENEARILLAEIVLGLCHMHKHKFVHCDIKVENIMLDAQGHVKLIDFGLSQEMTENEEPMSPIGSLIYMAPELLTKGTGGRHTDWWALGVLAHEMLTGRSPWSSLTDKKLIKKQIKTMDIVPPDFLSKEASEFIVQLLIQDHHKRLGSKNSEDVKKSSFFMKDGMIDWDLQESGKAPSALIPPKIAFVQTECDNALTMYKGSDTRPANWFLGVENLDSLPLVKGDTRGRSGSKKDKLPKPPPTKQRSKSPKVSMKEKGLTSNMNNMSLKESNSGTASGTVSSPRRGGTTTTQSTKPPAPPSTSTSNIKPGSVRKGTTPKSIKPKTPREVPVGTKPRLVSRTTSKPSSTWR